MTNKDEFFQLCIKGLKEKGWMTQNYQARLKLEVKQIEDQGEYDYFLDLHRKGQKFLKNENNLLVAALLGLVDEFNIDEPPTYTYGEFPDIDIDYISDVRDYLKKDWAPRTFGIENVCPIGSYGTFGIKGSIKDCARVYGKDSAEINAVTIMIEDKDEDGKPINWDTALELYPEFKKYCENNPDVADAAKRLLHRKRNLGMHAGGLIIANTPISRFVPLICNKDGEAVSAFVEGLHASDLGPMGLIKFDLLVVKDLERINNITALVKKRHNLPNFYALPGQGDWSDTSYLHDEKALALANKADLKGIFQFDSDGIRAMVRNGGVDSFADIAGYSALYRPGPLGMEMDKTYIKRKRGAQSYELHPLLEPILGKTYGVMIFQEQVMKILNIVGGIPLTHCEKARKAISKKKEKDFLPYKIPFLKTGKERLGWNDEEINFLWDQIAQFAEYGFNRSHSVAYAFISSRLLKLKAHYPLEFFAETLASEVDSDKMKEYKLQAEKNNIRISPIDINKSRWNFEIVDDVIYMGFSNVKGIGEDKAKFIVENQPYQSFTDFLNRYGTDSNVLKPLIGLGVFNFDDPNRAKLFEFAEHYKDQMSKRNARDSRAEKSRLGIIAEFMAMLHEGDRNDEAVKLLDTVAEYEKLKDFTTDYAVMGDKFKIMYLDPKQLHSIAKKYKKNVEGLKAKQAEDKPLSLKDFVPTGEIDSELKKIYEEIPPVAEGQYLGFNWSHVLEYSEDYQGGMTFNRFEDETKVILPVEVQVIRAAEAKTSKKGNVYYSMRVEDANCIQANVNIWQEDYERFADEFSKFSRAYKGNLLRLRLERPSGGFPTYTFESPPKHLRHKQIPAEKEKDFRLVVLKGPFKGQQETVKEENECQTTLSLTEPILIDISST